MQYSGSSKPPLFVALLEDITRRRMLESQLSQAQKLESIGQLAAGVAHEINTPIQYVGDNTQFIKESFDEIQELIGLYEGAIEQARQGTLTLEAIEELERELEAMDFEYLAEEIPKALEQSLEGINRVAKIVRAMKEFSHPGSEEKTMTDVNRALETTMTVARNEWKYVADVVLDLVASLPEVPCLPDELNQVFLNLIVNASHAIESVLEPGSQQKGTITLRTRTEAEWIDADRGYGERDSRARAQPDLRTVFHDEGCGQGDRPGACDRALGGGGQARRGDLLRDGTGQRHHLLHPTAAGRP